MRISDWSSDLCSSDLDAWTEDIERCEEQFDAFSERQKLQTTFHGGSPITPAALVCQRDRGANASCERERSHLSRLWPAGRMAPETGQIGRASCRERVCQYV